MTSLVLAHMLIPSIVVTPCTYLHDIKKLERASQTVCADNVSTGARILAGSVLAKRTRRFDENPVRKNRAGRSKVSSLILLKNLYTYLSILLHRE